MAKMNGYRNVVYDIKRKEVIVYTWDDDGNRIDFSVNFRPYLFIEDHKGVDTSIFGTKIKKVKEAYLVDAMTVTEAESRVVKEFEDAGIQVEYEVTAARESKILQVIK